MDGGTSWEDISTNINQHLNGIFFFDPYNGIAVGDEETYLVTGDGGMNWTSNDIEVSYDYRDVYFINDQTGFLAGRNGLYRSDDGGESWSLQWEDGFGTEIFQSIYFEGTLNGWATGRNGLLIHTRDGGENWTKHLPVSGSDLYDVHFLNPEVGVAVGEDGIIMRTEQGSYLAPGIVTPLADTSYCNEEPIILQTDVIGDSLTFTWYFADEVIPGADSSNLIFDPIQPENGGVYWYEAWNNAGIVANESFIISVRPVAEVLASPQDTTVFENDTLILNQAVAGALPISYQWQKNGEVIPGANFHIYPIYGVQLSDSGSYRCIVSNDCTIDTTEAAQLTVLPASSVNDIDLLNISVQPNPVSDYCLIHFGQEINAGEYRVYDITGTLVLTGRIQYLQTVNLNTERLSPGIYFCRLQTPFMNTSIKFMKK